MIKQRNTVNSLNPYIPGKPISEVKRELGLDKVIKLASNENPLGCSPKATEAVRKWATNMAIYPDGNCTDLRNALAEKLGLNPAQFLFGAGTDQILEIISQTFINPGDNAIAGHPSFSRYETVTRIMDGELIELPLTDDYRLNLDSFLEHVGEKTKVVWLCNPNNPTGTIITAKELRTFLEKLPREILVVLDEAYYEYARGGDYPESLKLLDEFDNIIILRTFSKIYGLAGLRIGYAISNEDIIGYLNRVRGPFNANAASQVAAKAALEDQEFLDRTLENNSRGKEYLYKAFEEMGLPYIPTHANFIMVNVKTDSTKLFADLLKKGVIVRSGDIFGMDEWLRVTIGTPEENEFFIRSLEEVLNNVNNV